MNFISLSLSILSCLSALSFNPRIHQAAQSCNLKFRLIHQVTEETFLQSLNSRVRRRKFLLNFWGRNVEFVWVKISSSAKFKNIYRLLLEMLYVRVTCLYRLVMWSASIAISLGSYSQVTRVSRELHFSKWVGLCHAVFRCFNNGLSPIWIWRSTFCQLPFDFSITK